MVNMLKIGDKIICIDNKLEYPERIIKGTLRVGTIYTIRSFLDEDCLRLEEIEMELFMGIEHALWVWRFRKVWDEEQLQKMNEKLYCEV